ncbi:MAG: UbiA family prenyltransferase [Verrucomicrobia bacterium]|nr:UbiA family prenyltransferase [Verrucomicrobiota bacterium]
MSRRHGRTLLILGRVSNLPTVWANVLTGWFLGGGTPDGRLPVAMLAASLVYYAGMVWNDVHDAEWDREHGKRRPIPLGQISRNAAFGVASFTTLAGFGTLWRLGAAPVWLAGLALSIGLYTVLHKRWAGSIWLMGACRLFLLVSTASVPGTSPPAVWLWGGSLLLYVAGITLAARGEDGDGRVPCTARLLLWTPAALGLALTGQTGPPGIWAALGAVILFLGWQWRVHRGFLKGTTPVGPFIGQLLAGMVLVDAMALAPLSLPAAAVCAALLPLNRGLQRLVPAT